MLLLYPKLNAIIANKEYSPALIAGLSESEIIALVDDCFFLIQHYKSLRTLMVIDRDKQRFQSYVAALFLAELLERITHYSKSLADQLPDLKNHQLTYLQALDLFNNQEPENDIIDESKNEASVFDSLGNYLYLGRKYILDKHALSNFIRLCFVRFKRILNTINEVFKHLREYKATFEIIDKYLHPIFIYLSWLAFLPRLVVNLTELCTTVLPGWFITNQEQQIGWQKRLAIHFRLHWFEWCNDIPWCIAGVLGCFVLTGGLAPIGVYLPIALFGYDIILAGIRSVINLGDLYLLREQYQNNPLLEIEDPSSAELNQAYLQAIDRHIRFQQMRAALAMFNVIGIFLAASLAIPAIAALSPFLPLTGAILIFAITVAVYFITKLLDEYIAPAEFLPEVVKEKPITNRWGLFASTPKVNEDEELQDMSYNVRFQLSH